MQAMQAILDRSSHFQKMAIQKFPDYDQNQKKLTP